MWHRHQATQCSALPCWAPGRIPPRVCSWGGIAPVCWSQPKRSQSTVTVLQGHAGSQGPVPVSPLMMIKPPIWGSRLTEAAGFPRMPLAGTFVPTPARHPPLGSRTGHPRQAQRHSEDQLLLPWGFAPRRAVKSFAATALHLLPKHSCIRRETPQGFSNAQEAGQERERLKHD